MRILASKLRCVVTTFPTFFPPACLSERTYSNSSFFHSDVALSRQFKYFSTLLSRTNFPTRQTFDATRRTYVVRAFYEDGNKKKNSDFQSDAGRERNLRNWEVARGEGNKKKKHQRRDCQFAFIFIRVRFISSQAQKDQSVWAMY